MIHPTTDLLACFTSRFSSTPSIIWAPGRINLIGEHTDYNKGFVMPGAIDRGITFLVASRQDHRIRMYAADLDEQVEWNLGEVPETKSNWVDYVYGVLQILREKGYEIKGIDCVFGGDVPIGSGLSSSAALECGIGFCAKELFALDIDSWQLALYCQEAEHKYVGVNCGIMDQFASVHGKSGHVMMLDCRSLEYEYVPADLGEYSIVLCNTLVSHSLAESGYNTRRAQCEKGVKLLQSLGEPVSSLRDVTEYMLLKHQSRFEEVIFKRCHFIIQENQRVLAANNALRHGELATLGELIYASHEGLQNEYEVSCPELDFLVDLTREDDQVLGARMVGGGFGGCTLNLVKVSYRDIFLDNMKRAYLETYNKHLPVYYVSLANGTNLLKKVQT